MSEKLPNLLTDEWIEDAIARADKLYPRGKRALARLIARSSRHAIGYLEQCPALIVFASWGYDAKGQKHRVMIANRVSIACKSGPKLRALIEEFGGCYPARKLRGSVIFSRHFKTIMDLRKLPPSVVAQAIPEKHGQQALWLDAIRELSIYRLPENRRDEIWEWAFKALSAAIVGVRVEGAARPEVHVSTIFDYFVRGNHPIVPAWTWQNALDASARWHAELARRTNEEKFLKQHGIAFDEKVDYGRLPERVEIMCYEFLALRSAEELYEEGRAMKHCVGSYAPDVIRGTSRIYSIRQHGCRIATMEIVPTRIKVTVPIDLERVPGDFEKVGKRTRETVPLHKLIQIKSVCNSPPPQSAAAAVELFLDRINFRYGERDPNAIMTPHRPLRRMGNV